MRWIAIAGLIFVGCTSTDYIKCPASPPQGVYCIQCGEPDMPSIEAIEDLERSYLSLERSLLECQSINRACVGRDRIWTESWNEDCE